MDLNEETMNEIIVNGSIYLLGYIIVCIFGYFLVGFVLSQLDVGQKQDYSQSEIKGAGKIIGIIERILTITFVYLNVPTAIGFIFAGKSIIRFESSKERQFAEYYLVGTLTSLTFAIIIGVMCVYLVELST